MQPYFGMYERFPLECIMELTVSFGISDADGIDHGELEVMCVKQEYIIQLHIRIHHPALWPSG